MADMKHGVRIYHWRHGWIPLDHFAALKKAHGSHKGAERALEKAHAAGHAHGSFASTGTHKAGVGGGSHLRRADGFQPVANEHLRRDKHVIAAFHPESRQFHLLDTQRGHTAVISEQQARDIHMQGHKIIGISKSESGGTQIKVQNMANGQVHRIDAQRDHLHGVGGGENRPGSARKPADATVAVKPDAAAERARLRQPGNTGEREDARAAKRHAAAVARAQARAAAVKTAAPAKTHESMPVSGTPREDKVARFKAAQAERVKAYNAAHPKADVGPNAQQKIDAAAVMYGKGSPKHLEAQRRFGAAAAAEAKPATVKPATPKPGTKTLVKAEGDQFMEHGRQAFAAGDNAKAAEHYDRAAARYRFAGEKRLANVAAQRAENHRGLAAQVAQAKASRAAKLAPAKLAPEDVTGHQAALKAAYDKLGHANLVGGMMTQHNARRDVEKAQAQFEQAKAIRAGQPVVVKATPHQPALPADLQRRVDNGLAPAEAHRILNRRVQNKRAYDLQVKGNRLRNIDRLEEHRKNIEAADIAENHREILLRKVDRKIAAAGGAARDRAAAAEELKGGAVEKHFQAGGSIHDAPANRLFDYLKAHPERFEVKGSRKNGQVSDTYKITDRTTGAIAWRKDDGQAKYGAIKEKLAADVGNKLGFFEHRANLDITRDGRANHVMIEHAPGVEGFGERNRGNERGVGEAIRNGSDPASLMRMMMFDYLVANDEDRHYMNFHVVDEGGGKMRAAILDHGRAFGGAQSNFYHADKSANFNEWFQKYKRYSARGWDANAVARAAYPNDSDASRAYDQITRLMKSVDVGKVVQDAMNAPGMDQLPQAKREEWAQLIQARHAHLTDQKNKAGIIRAMKGM